MIPSNNPSAEEAFAKTLDGIAPQLRNSLVAYFGHDRGGAAFSEALVYAWEHQAKILGLTDPIPYLFRVGRSRTRNRRLIPRPADRIESERSIPDVEPGLNPALMRLTRPQRTAVVLIVGWEWSYAEVAALLGISKGSVQRHAERGMAKLRTELGV